MNVFSQEGVTRDEVIASIVPGKILYLLAPFSHLIEPKNKYFVVVGFNERPLLLKFNSENKFTQTNKNLHEYQFRVKHTQYNFLEHDSYLDCGTVWYMLTYEEIINQLLNDPKRIVGQILKAHENEIVRLTQKSKSIASNNKRIISQSFRN